jgi:MoaA/NifB/PqqE/SkfB family radical SAM enzyme
VLSLKYGLAKSWPGVLKPAVSYVKLALNSSCNLRCKGCLYGRSFLPGESLDRHTLMRLLDELAALGIARVHFHGGEPLLHPDLDDLISGAIDRGITPSLGTNGLALNERRLDRLHERGLRSINVGLYGVGRAYDDYVGHDGRYGILHTNLLHARQRHPDIALSLGWLIMRPSCNARSLHAAFGLAEELDVPLGAVLLQYDFPYFSEGEQHELQLFARDRPALEDLSRELLSLKRLRPARISTSEAAIASIPDWVVGKQAQRIPCVLDDVLFVLPNGAVHVCPKHAAIGNIRNDRLRDVVHGPGHCAEVRDCFALKCDGCQYRFDRRTDLDAASRRRYSDQAQVSAVPARGVPA